MLTWMVMALISGAEASTMLLVDATNDRLVAIDTVTQVNTVIQSLGFAYDFGDATYDPATGIYYIIVARPSTSLYAYDTATGTMTLRGSLAINEVFAAGFDPSSGYIYAVQNSTSNFYRMDPSNGTMTLIGNIGVAADGGYWDSVRGGLVVNRIATQELHLVLANGNHSLIGDNGVYSDNTDFDRDYGTDLLWSYDWSRNYRSLSSATLAIQSSGSYGFASDAMAIVDSVSPPPPAPLEFSFSSGSCPGPLTLSFSGFTPFGAIGFVRGTGPGSFSVPRGGCAGTTMDLASPSFMRFLYADASGNLTLNVNSQAHHCGYYYQAMDMSTCGVTDYDTP